MARLPERDLAHCLEHAERGFSELRGERVLVTGATGFYGLWLLETFAWANRRLSLGAGLTVLVRDPERFRAAAPHLASDGAIHLHRGDVRDFAEPDGTHAYVLHCATPASKTLNDTKPLEMIDVIYAGTRHTLDVATRIGCRRFLFASSGAVYGLQPPSIIHVTEDFTGGPDPTLPGNAYAEAKRLAELLCAAHEPASLRQVVFARGFAFVGPHLPLDAHFAIGNFVRDALDRPAIVVEGDGEPYRSYLYAADLAAWLWVLLVHGAAGRAYNVGSEDARPLGDVARLIGRLANKPVEIRRSPAPGAPRSRYVPSTARARLELGLQERVPLEEALGRTLAWHAVLDRSA